jgi:hypothetical protein
MKRLASDNGQPFEQASVLFGRALGEPAKFNGTGDKLGPASRTDLFPMPAQRVFGDAKLGANGLERAAAGNLEFNARAVRMAVDGADRPLSRLLDRRL